jgi:hypothetical protein
MVYIFFERTVSLVSPRRPFGKTGS